MNMSDYAKRLRTFRLESTKTSAMKIVYPTLGFVGEAGEVANTVKKISRDKSGIVTRDDREQIAKELGDCLFYMLAICDDVGLDPDYVAQLNYEKLKSRFERGVIGGSGDNR